MLTKVLLGIGLIICAAITVVFALRNTNSDQPAQFMVSDHAHRASYVVCGGAGSILHSECMLPIIREAYREIGINITYKSLPSLRSLEMANSVYDAEMGRVPEFIREYSNLDVVPVPLLEFRICAYSLNPNIRIDSWDDIFQYSIARRRGVKLLDIKLDKHEQCIVVDDIKQVAELLAIKRIDLAVSVEVDFEYALKGLLDAGAQLKPIYMQPVMSAYVYHPINKRNADLIPDLSQVLRRMVDNGNMQLHWRRFVTGVEKIIVPLSVSAPP